MRDCPICGKELKRDYQDIIAGNVSEERDYCKEGHYSYEFHYGGTEYYIGDKRFGWWYSDSREKRMRIRKLIDAEIDILKDNYEE